MKYLFLPVIIVLSCSSLYSQECAYRKNAKDEFTGDQLKMTKWQTLINHTGLLKNLAFHLSLVEINNNEFVEMKYELKQDKSESIGLSKSKSKLMLKLENDAVVSMEYAGDKSYTFAKREYKRTKGGSIKYEYDLTCKFTLSAEDKEKLSSNKIVKVRLILEKETVEFDINEKLKAPLLGFAHRGLRPKKFAPQEYFITSLVCL